MIKNLLSLMSSRLFEAESLNAGQSSGKKAKVREDETLGLKFMANDENYNELDRLSSIDFKIAEESINAAPTPKNPEKIEAKSISEITTGPETDETEPETNANEPEKDTSEQSLKEILTQLGKDLDQSDFSTYYKEQNQKTFTDSEILRNIDKLKNDSNPEIAALGSAIAGVFEQTGVGYPKPAENDKNRIANRITTYQNIVLETIFAAIKGEDLDPDEKNLVSMSVGEQSGITVDDLLALDKNGDGSIAEELNALFSDKTFVDTLNLKIQRQKNKEENIKTIDKLDAAKKEDGIITVEEIAAQFGNNEIADLFKNSDGSVDRALLIALGGTMSKDGNYTITTGALTNRIYEMDADRDGKITQEEVSKYKESVWYKHISYTTMMEEMERSNDKKGNFDNKFTLDDMEKFTINNPTATKEQKEFFRIITDIADKNLKEYIMKQIGGGSSTVTIEQFTKAADSDGDGVVTKEELQAYVDKISTKYHQVTQLKHQ